MWGRLGPRFPVEAAFLIPVAVGLAIADADPLWVVVVMAGAWLLVSLIELLAARQPRYPAVAPAVVEPAIAEPEPEPAVADAAVEEEVVVQEDVVVQEE